ncbi:BgTH12-02394 [Blumeria graminis f. sp. triticale]|uniref:BgTH12-02394 n=1 Tax=Blumeria graminis f. sp. triticale TaxID=1689686 RepID=A0A9W4D6D0_BLUGR|nr:BgTH12-02394 [Blumeria graminis f. sp. triticale]
MTLPCLHAFPRACSRQKLFFGSIISSYTLGSARRPFE